MVSIFAVYDSSANVTRWVIANEEGFNWQTADTISSELQLDSDELIEKIVLGSWTWDQLITDYRYDERCPFDEEEWYLFKYCEFEFYKKDCKYFNNKVRLAINQLPTDLFIRLSKEYIAWAELEGVGCLTDGFDVFMDDAYEPPVVEDPKELKEMKDFSEWLKELNYGNDGLRLFRSYITICVAGNSVKIPFHADTYELLDRFLDKAIKEF